MGRYGAALWGAMGQAPPYLLVEPQHSSMGLYGAIWGHMGLYGAALWGAMGQRYGAALWGSAMGQRYGVLWGKRPHTCL